MSVGACIQHSCIRLVVVPRQRGAGKLVAQLMGHANVDTTLNVSTQVLDGALGGHLGLHHVPEVLVGIEKPRTIAGMTPTIAHGSPDIWITRPMTNGSASNSRRQAASPMTTAGALPARSSPGSSGRPSNVATPTARNSNPVTASILMLTEPWSVAKMPCTGRVTNRSLMVCSFRSNSRSSEVSLKYAVGFAAPWSVGATTTDAPREERRSRRRASR